MDIKSILSNIFQFAKNNQFKVKLMKKAQLKRFGMNLLKFTAPMLAVFFTQLSLGVSMRDAFPVVILAGWGVVADFFKKYGEN